MTQALYAHMNNKKKSILKIIQEKNIFSILSAVDNQANS
jgi:hypothetical protein